MIRARIWDLCSGPTTNRNALGQDLHTCCYESLSPCLSVADSPSVLCEAFLKWSSQEASGMLGKLDVHFALFLFSLEKLQDQGNPLVQHCTDLGEEQCSQSETAPVNLILMSFFLVFVAQVDASASPPCSSIFTSILSIDSTSCPFPEGDRSWEPPILPSFQWVSPDSGFIKSLFHTFCLGFQLFQAFW